MEYDTYPPVKKFPWFWIFMIVLVLSVAQCTREETLVKEREQKELRVWQNTADAAFRFCITTVAGESGTVSPEQIAACKKAVDK